MAIFFGRIVAKFPAHQQRATRWCMVGLRCDTAAGGSEGRRCWERDFSVAVKGLLCLPFNVVVVA